VEIDFDIAALFDALDSQRRNRAASHQMVTSSVRFYRINVTSHEVVDLGEVSGYTPWPPGVDWAEPGSSVLLSRTINGLTNIWKYSFKNRSLTQITSGTGPDFSPMPDPGGKGVYFVNGKVSGALTAYHVHSKASTDIVAEDATSPIISSDGKRVMYVIFPAPERAELWVSNVDASHKVKIATGTFLVTGDWAPDNFHLSFQEPGVKAGDKVFIVGADGSGLRQLPRLPGTLVNSSWSQDQKSIYVTSNEKASSVRTVWKWSVGGTNSEKVVDNCGIAGNADPGGQYLLSVVTSGEKIGIKEVSISDKKCISCFPASLRSMQLLLAMVSRSYMPLPLAVKPRFIASHGKTVRISGASGRIKGPFCFSPVLRRRQCLRFFQGPFHHRLCTSRRSRGPLSSEPEMTLQFTTPDGPWRTYVLWGDAAKAKAACQDFLTLWKDADPDIPILKQGQS
jgi:hypothetical protein